MAETLNTQSGVPAPSERMSYPSFDSRLRPFGSGVIPHEKGLATLIIVTSGNGTRNAETRNPKDYLNNFSNYIESISPEAPVDDRNPVFSDGIVPDLKLDGSHTYYGVFNNISVVSFNEMSAEIVKVHQNFSGFWNAFFMGEQPKIFSFSGIFLDVANYPYYQEFMVAYRKWLAGTKCVENKARLKFVYDGKIIEGYLLGVNISATADAPYAKQFSFQFLVTNEGWLRVNRIPIEGSTYYNYSLEDAVGGLSNTHRIIRGLPQKQRP